MGEAELFWGGEWGGEEERIIDRGGVHYKYRITLMTSSMIYVCALLLFIYFFVLFLVNLLHITRAKLF